MISTQINPALPPRPTPQSLVLSSLPSTSFQGSPWSWLWPRPPGPPHPGGHCHCQSSDGPGGDPGSQAAKGKRKNGALPPLTCSLRSAEAAFSGAQQDTRPVVRQVSFLYRFNKTSEWRIASTCLPDVMSNSYLYPHWLLQAVNLTALGVGVARPSN